MASTRTCTVTVALAASIGMVSGMANAAEVKVMATAAIKEAYLELVPLFERASENKVVTIWAGTVDVTRRIGGGEVVDLVIMSANGIDDFIRQGKFAAGSRVDVAKSGVGAAVRTGLPHPDISSGEALRKTVLRTKSIAYSTGPSGVYLAGLFERLGVAETIKPKVIQVPPGQSVGEIVARGDAELGFQQVSELLSVNGIDFLGPLSPDVQQTTVFAAGIHAAARQGDAAKALVRFLTSPEAATVIRKTGMEPG